jgi:two-component system catabolic regulation response regulator CreB
MKPKILIVEDEPGIADTLQYALRTEGFEPHWCATGEDALAHARAMPPALVVLDVGLPDANGFEIFRRLRQTNGDVPVVFLTARSDEIDRVVGLELGADDYIAKPFSPRELVARVRGVLRRSAKAGAPQASAAAGATATIASGPIVVDEGRMQVRYYGRGGGRARARCGRERALAARSSSRATSSACSGRSPGGPAMSSRARRCSTASGAATARAWTARSMRTSRRCAPR